MNFLQLLDQIDDSAPKSCQTCVYMATHEKCDGCLVHPADYLMTPRPRFRYNNWTPGNWLRREHEQQLAGNRAVVIGRQGEAEVYANRPAAEQSKHLNYVAEQCGYYGEPLQRSEVYHTDYGCALKTDTKVYMTSEGLFRLVWVSDRLERIERLDYETREAVNIDWSRHTPDPSTLAPEPRKARAAV